MQAEDREREDPEGKWTVVTVVYHTLFTSSPSTICRWVCKRILLLVCDDDDDDDENYPDGDKNDDSTIISLTQRLRTIFACW